MRKILILAHSPDIGGAELALKSLVDSLSNKFEFTIVIPSNKKVDAKVNNIGVTYVYLPLPWWCYEAHDAPKKIYKKELVRNYQKLLSLADNHDVLVTNTITIPWLGFAATQLSKKHIWYVHEFGDIDHNLKFILGYDKSLSIIDSTSSRVLTISEAVVDHISRVINKDKIDIIHQAIDLDRLTKINSKTQGSGLKLLCMGAIKKSKGQHIAIDAIKLLNAQGYDTKLDIVGPSANDQYVDQLKTSAKETYNINVEVRSYDIVKELSTHDALLMCSENEALGRVTIESMAASVPVIGYASPATAYLLQNNRGLLYSKNTPKSLSQTLISFIENNSSANIITAKNFVSKTYTPNVQAKDFITSLNKTEFVSGFNNNIYSSYISYLDSNGLLINKVSKNLSDYKKIAKRATPKFIKNPVKKMIKKV